MNSKDEPVEESITTSKSDILTSRKRNHRNVAVETPHKRQKSKDINLSPAPVKSILPSFYKDDEIWAEKYRPTGVSEIIGNTSTIDTLKQWLKKWTPINSKPSTFTNSALNLNLKAVLISGPPGIGKTTAVHLVSRELGFEVFETNASDARSKKRVNETLSVENRSISILFNKLNLEKKDITKQVIVMDEVDGMSSEDRGGMQELIKMIKVTKIPIICICNDRMKANVRSLANYCVDLRFHRPNKNTVLKMLQNIVEKENIKVDEATLDNLIQGSSGDIRQLLNSLQLLSLRERDSKDDATWKFKKDSVLTVDHTQALQVIFNESQHRDKFNMRYEAYFMNYDLVPLLVAESYISSVRNYSKNKGQGQDVSLETLEMLSNSSNAVCDSDIVSSQIMLNQNWGLLPLSAALNLRIANLSKGGVGFTAFPEWLGKFSSAKRKKKLLSEMDVHMRVHTSGASPESIRLDYFCPLKAVIFEPLRKGKEGVEQTLKFMDSYNLTRDDVFETLEEIKFGEKSIELDAKVKREFTRLYNLNSHRAEDLIVGLKRTKVKKIKVEEDVLEEDTEEGSRSRSNSDSSTGSGRDMAELVALASIKRNTRKAK